MFACPKRFSLVFFALVSSFSDIQTKFSFNPKLYNITTEKDPCTPPTKQNRVPRRKPLWKKFTSYVRDKIQGASMAVFDALRPTPDEEHEIVFGQSLPLLGEYSLYSDHIIKGIQAKFFATNDAGGIGGKTLRLATYNDFGDQEKAFYNTKKILNDEKTDLFLGSVGDSGVTSTLSMIRDGKILMLFPLASDPILQASHNYYLVNGIGNSEIQINKIIDHAASKLHLKRFAIFYPDTVVGREQCWYTCNMIKEIRLKEPLCVSYDPANPRIFESAEKIVQENPESVICISSYMPTTRLMSRLFRRKKWNLYFFGLDTTCFAGQILEPLRDLKFKYCSFVPLPKVHKYQIVESYLRDMKKYFPNDEVSLFGLAYYINASIVVSALNRIEQPMKKGNLKESLLEQIEKMKDEDLGGFIVDFNFSNRQAYPLQPTLFRGNHAGKNRKTI